MTNYSTRGLASASSEIRKRVAKSGGTAKHFIRGLAAASPETRKRVAQMGGAKRALDREGLKIAGSLGAAVVKAKYGRNYYVKIGAMGGGTVNKKYGSKYFSEIGKIGGAERAKNIDGLIEAGRKGGQATKEKTRRFTERNVDIAQPGQV